MWHETGGLHGKRSRVLAKRVVVWQQKGGLCGECVLVRTAIGRHQSTSSECPEMVKREGLVWLTLYHT